MALSSGDRLGYDVVEVKRNFEKEGISGEVGQFNVEHNQYPQYCISPENGATMDHFQSTALKGMFDTTNITEGIMSDEDKDMGIFIYIEVNNKKMRLGKIQPRQVKAFLKLFDSSRVIGYLDANTKLEGDLLYVLSE